MNLKLLLFAFSPYLIGYMVNYALMNWYGMISMFLGILFLIYWYYVGYKSYDYVQNKMKSLLIGNSFVIINIILILVQEIILKEYMLNIIGLSSQMFYLAPIGITTILGRIIFFFTSSYKGWYFHILSFILMIIVYYAGYSAKLKKRNYKM
jgi:hypothetical protein